jgi:ATP-binding cassette, subfamily B, multidrug efflux pump
VSHYLWKIRPYFRQVAGLLFVGFVSGTIMNIAVVLPPILLGRAIDIALALEKGTATHKALIIAAFAYLGGCAVNLLAQIGKRWWLRTANQRTLANMRANSLRGVLSWPMGKLHNESVGGIMARVIGDAQVFMVGFNEATTELLDTWLFSLSLFTAMMIIDTRLALMAMALVPIAFLLAYLSGNWVRARTLGMRRAAASLTAALQEHLTGARILRLFGRTNEAVRLIDSLSGNLRTANLSEIRLRLGLQPVYSVLVTAGVLMVVWLGGERVVAGTLTTGSLIAFMQLYIRFVGRGHRIPSFFNRIQAAGAAYERIEEMLAPVPGREGEPKRASFKPNHITGLTAPAPPPPETDTGPLSAELKNVSFRYPGSDLSALDGISVDIPAGSLIAVTGPIGAGKSALLRVLTGVYHPQGGRVNVDGASVADWDPDERAARVAYVPQDPGLFSGTVRENLGLDEGDRKLESVVLARSGLQRDVMGFPEGVKTLIGERGIRISGGQRQRIALARALAAGRGQSPGLLLLDDPFASIDVETEGLIITALREAYGPGAAKKDRATLILCSHRLAAFPQADRVIVLDRGRIIEEGTHESLLSTDGLYARIFKAQHRIDDSSLPERAL